jgi:hypothetical protein
MLSVANKPFKLSVIMLNVIMLSAITMNVVAPDSMVPQHTAEWCFMVNLLIS